jgi:uncharacterized iron-regulated membrane protein
MSVTGVLLTYQRQIQAWADVRGYEVTPQPRRLAVDALLAKVAEARPDISPTTLVVRSDPSAPASLAIAAGRQLFIDPYTGHIFGEGNGQQVRAFFRSVVEWHRYLAAAGTSRPIGRAVTGASNLAFLFIVISGIFLWFPRVWRWSAVRGVLWFKGGLRGKARDFNWHNTIGFWSAIPLAIVVAGGVVISYPWATGLVYRAYGEAPPAPARGGGRGGGAGGGERATRQLERVAGADLETLMSTAAARMPEWKTISIPLRPGSPRVVLALDSGDGGQPQKRATLTLDRLTGREIEWEPYSSQSPGRQARTWLRFAHTGEVYGFVGQTVAGLVSAGGAVLVWTGLALALRRFAAWRNRGREALPRAA